MKTINEWQADNNQHEDVDILIDKLDTLADQIREQLDSFTGERPQGLLRIIGAYKDLKTTITEIKMGIASDNPAWLTK